MHAASEFIPASYYSCARVAVVVCALFVGGGLAAPRSDQVHAGPIVNLGFSKYQGIHNSSANINQWFKIPYAIPPTGTLRWHAPQPIDSIDPWGTTKDPIDATRPGPMCVQGSPAWQWSDFANPPDPKGSEDCLHVNVMAPADRKDGDPLLPVFVKIHGGGYVQGQADIIDGFALLKHSRNGIVYVSLQYRLGAYGFLASEDVRSDGVANAGLLDQRLAMNFVQKYIHLFGGDKSKVTVHGGSAGGGAVSLHLMMFGGKKTLPFQAAIADWPLWQPLHGDAILEAQYRHLLHEAKCSNLTCLRALPEGVLASASQQTYVMGYFSRPKPWYGYGDSYYGPSVDGKTIVDLPSKEFRRGSISPVPIMVTRSKFEGYFHSNASLKTEPELKEDLKALIPAFTDELVTDILTHYPKADYQDVFYRREAIMGDMFINCPTKWILAATVKKKKGAYKLLFQAGTELHGASAEYVFDPNVDRKQGSNATLAGYMKDWYLSFATNADPNRMSWLGLQPGTKPTWPPYGDTAETLVVHDDSIEVANDADVGAKCDYWAELSELTRI